jgi:hypothetical protein
VEVTSLNEEIASTTSFVKVCPFPDVPINTVGLIAWNVVWVRIQDCKDSGGHDTL